MQRDKHRTWRKYRNRFLLSPMIRRRCLILRSRDTLLYVLKYGSIK